MTITAADIAALRAKTGAGMMDCKKALEESNGNSDQAIENLRKNGAIKAAKRADKIAAEGLVASYIHGLGKIGVLVEVNCETDFVARNEIFKEFVHNVALHIAASAPKYVTKEEVPEEVIAAEKDIYKKQALNEGKPEAVVEKIAEGKLKKFYEENCLIDQLYVKNNDMTIGDILKDAILKIGENIVIRRFVRFVLGEEI